MPEIKDKLTGRVVTKLPYNEEGEVLAEQMVQQNSR